MRKIDNPFTFTTGTIGYPILFVLIIWLVYWFEMRFSVIFNSYGVYPRTLEGLKGILFSPFIHGSVKHLFNNSIPLLVLSTALFYFYRKDSWRVLIFGLLLSGFLTWLIGRPSYHIGASGVVYMLVSFLFFKGVFSSYYRLIALSLIIVFLYGGLLWYVFPIEKGISWEGHLSGLFVGFLFAFLFKAKIEKPKLYNWEQDDYKEEDDAFMKHFDENGNFRSLPPDPPPEEGGESFSKSKHFVVQNDTEFPNSNQQISNEALVDKRQPTIKITYTYKKKEE